MHIITQAWYVHMQCRNCSCLHKFVTIISEYMYVLYALLCTARKQKRTVCNIYGQKVKYIKCTSYNVKLFTPNTISFPQHVVIPYRLYSISVYLFVIRFFIMICHHLYIKTMRSCSLLYCRTSSITFIILFSVNSFKNKNNYCTVLLPYISTVLYNVK